MTRPAESSKQFLAALKGIAGPFRGLISPAFEYEPVDYGNVLFDEAVFTSKAGAKFAPDGIGRPAWCVGHATAREAEAKGYRPRVGSGNAADLSAMILEHGSSAGMVHFRGENVRIDVKEILVGAGLKCADTVVYRKSICGISDEGAALTVSTGSFIVPIFSSETVSIIQTWNINFAQAWVVAMSEDVASSAICLEPESISTLERPNLNEMAQITSRLIA